MNVTPIDTTPLAVARGIARHLRPAEDTIDASIAANAELLASTVRGRLKLGTDHSPDLIRDMVRSAVAGLAALADAREHASAFHRHAASARDILTLEADDVGCTIMKPVGAEPAEAAQPARREGIAA